MRDGARICEGDRGPFPAFVDGTVVYVSTDDEVDTKVFGERHDLLVIAKSVEVGIPTLVLHANAVVHGENDYVVLEALHQRPAPFDLILRKIPGGVVG